MPKVPVLLDRYGNPIERAALTTEVAGPTLTGVRSPLTGYPGDGLNPRRLAAILREADQGDPLRYLELAETIEERDLHYAGVLGTRKRSVAQLEVSVDAASDDKADVDKADLVRAWLTRDELAVELFDMLDAIGKGVSHTEIVWDTSEGQWRALRLEWRDPRWFRFDRRDGRTPLLLGEHGEELPLPPWKFITAVIRAKSGLPIRSGLARLAAWSWMFKAFTLRDWAIFVQTFGQPIRVGKYPAGATEQDKDTLFRAVANIAGDCAAIVPDSMTIEFIEASVTQSIETYEKRADWLDRQVSKAVLGQTATTDAIAGGHAVGREHRQVQEDIERADARALAAVLNRDLIRPWMDLEYGPGGPYPSLRIGRGDERDIEKVTAAVARLVPLGLRVGQSVMRDMLGIEEPAADEEILMAPAPPPAASRPPPPQAREDATEEARHAAESRAPDQGPGQAVGDAIDALADAAERRAAPAADALVDAVRALALNAESLEEVRDRLLALRPGMPAAELARHLQAALAYAELTGRAEIAGEGT